MVSLKLNKISRVLCLILVSVLLLTMVIGCSNTDKASGEAPKDDSKVYKLKFSHHDPATSGKGKMFQEWADEIKTATNGRVVVTLYPSSTLGAPPDGINMVNTGITDILWSFTGFFNKDFVATDVISLPLLGIKDSESSVDIFYEMYETSPEIQKEFEGLKVLSLYAHPPACIGSDKLIDSVDDLKGLKMRVPTGPATDVIKEWGAVPVTIPTPDIYQSLEKKVINGFAFDWAGVPSFKLNEAVDYFLDLKLYSGPMFIVMNEDKWNEIPADLQKIIEEHSGKEFSKNVAANEDLLVKTFIEKISKEGKTVTFLDDQGRAPFKTGGEKITAQWIENVTKAGIDGKALHQKALDTIKKYSK